MLRAKRWRFFAAILAVPAWAAGGVSAQVASGQVAWEQRERLYLQKNWEVQSSCVAKAGGEEISMPGFVATGWHHAEIPATVAGALVTDGTYPDPDYGMNLKSFPGMDYSHKTFFANQDMPADSPFRCAWWFRTEFSLPEDYSGKHEWLDFLGINYRANLWVNGQKVADAKDMAGTYRTFEFEATKYLRGGGPNALALEIFAPGKDDLGMTWVDWNPTPPDKNMGIWKEVFLKESGDVTVRRPFVAAKLDGEYKTAALTVSAELRNTGHHAVKGVFHAAIAQVHLEKPVELAAGEARTVRLTPEEYPQLKVEHPGLWWPYQMGEPHLYQARFAFTVGDEVLDATGVTLGIREVTSEMTDKGHVLFRVNGRRVLIRGAAWAPDLLLRWSSKRLDADLAYVRDMGLNAIRLEGRLDRDEFFEKTDRLGILVMPGWTCCDAWQRGKDWKDEQREIAAASLTDQITRLRNHPSVFVWLNGSDEPPPADVERTYLGIEKKLEWPNPVLSSASEEKSKVTGESGVKMTGPYEYVPPVYWLADTQAGGAYGFNTETSPGPAIPPRESLEKFIPMEHLWPIDEVWNYHAGLERFTNIRIFTEGLERRYGRATSLDDFERKAQAMTYDGERAMFEAYGGNKYKATGVIQWMLNNSWPSLIWHLYDYYHVPAGGYFGTKKALEPVHVQYSYDDDSVAVVNGEYEALTGMRVTAKLYNLDAKEMGAREATVDLPADSSTRVFALPKAENLTTTYFLRLELHDRAGKLISRNFYWLSTKPDTLAWAKRKDTVYTPQAQYADLRGLETLPQVRVAAKSEFGDGRAHVEVSNSSASVAFMIHLRLTRGENGEDVTPIFWTENYFSLLPGESRTIIGRFSGEDEREIKLKIDGFNVIPETLKP